MDKIFRHRMDDQPTAVGADSMQSTDYDRPQTLLFMPEMRAFGANSPYISPPPNSPDSWNSAVNGDWTKAADWSAGVPTSSNDATVAVSGKYTVTIDSADVANSLTINDSAATVSATSGGTLSITTTLAVTAGTFSLGAGSEISGGTISVGQSGKFLVSGGGTLSGVSYQGTLNLSASSSQLYLAGNDGFAGTGGTGAGTTNLTGENAYLYALNSTTISNSDINIGNNSSYSFLYELDTNGGGGTLTLAASTSVTQTGIYAQFEGSGYAGDTILNQGAITAAVSGGAFDVYDTSFVNAGQIVVGNGGAFSINSTSFTNSGSINVSGNSNTGFYIDATNFANTGTISVVGVNGGTDGDAYAYIGSSNTGSWSNQGVISVSKQGEAVLGGTFTLATFQSVQNSGGYLGIDGTMLNAGTLVVAGLTAGYDTYSLYGGGTIQGGTVADANGDLAILNGTLSAVTYDGTINLNNTNEGLTVADGLTVAGASGTGAGTINLTGESAYLYALNSTTISNADINIGNNSSYSFLYELDTNGGGGTLTLAASTSVTQTGIYAQFEGSGYAGDTILNQGAITAAVSGGAFDVYDTSFVNAGQIVVGNGGAFSINSTSFTNSGSINVSGNSNTGFYIDATNFANTGTISVVGVNGGTDGDAYAYIGSSNTGSWSNQGVISVSKQGEAVLGGTFTLATFQSVQNSGGYLGIDGTMLSAGTLVVAGLTAGYDTYSLYGGGTIQGGTVADANGDLAIFDGTLSAVTYDGTINLNNTNEGLTVADGLTVAGASGTGAGTINLTGESAYLYALNSTTISNADINIGNNSSYSFLYELDTNGGGGTLTLAASTSVTQTGIYAQFEGSGYAGDTILNQGAITAAVSGGAFDVYDTSFVNAGQIVVGNGGAFSINSTSFVNSGSIGVSGSNSAFYFYVNSGTSFSNSGSIDVSSGGTAYLQPGTFTNLRASTLTGGSYEVDSGSAIELVNNVSIVTDAATLILSGANSVIESYNSTKDTYTTLDQKLTTISSAGKLELLSGRNFSASTAFSDGGLLQVGGTTFTATSGLTISSTGTLAGFGAVAGAVADAGTIIAAGGTLIFSSAVSGAGGLTAAAGATVDLTTGGALTEAISGAGTLKLDRSTAYTLAASASIADVLIDAGATLTGTGNLSGALADGGTLSATSGTLKVDGAFTGAGIVTTASGAVLDLAGGGAFAGAVAGAGVLRLDGSNAFTLQTGAILSVAAVSVDAGATLDLTQGGSLSSSISGAGTLQLDGPTAYSISAGTTLALGALRVDAAVELSGSGTVDSIVADAGTVNASSGTLTLAALTGTGSLTASSGATVDLTGGGALTEAVSGAGTLQLDGATPYTLSGATIAIAAVAVDAAAVLSGSGTITGGITDAGTIGANGGVLKLAGVTGTGTLLAAAGATLDLLAGGALTEAISGGGTLQLDASTYTLIGATVLAGFVTVDAGAALSGTGTITGGVTDAGTITANGGLLQFTGIVAGAGGLAAAAGATINLTAGGALTETISGAGTLQLDGGVYGLSSATVSVGTVTVDATATLSGSGTITGSVVDGGTITAEGGLLQFEGAVSGGGAFIALAGATVDLTTGGALTETVSGMGALQLDAASYTLSDATITVATVAVDAGAALSGNGTVQGVINDAGMINASGGTLTLATITGIGALSAAANAVIDLTEGGVLTEDISGAGTLQLDGATAYNLSAGTLGIASLNVDVGVLLSGTGTIDSSVDNSGTITASGSKLVVAGLITGTGVLQAGSGSVLDLTAGGSINEAVSGAGTLELGGAYLLGSGALTVGTVFVDAGASLTGTGTLTSAIADAGVLTATGGTLTVKGGLSGAGTVSAASGAILDFLGSGDFGGNFVGAGMIDIAAALTLTQGASLTAATIDETANVTLGANTALSLATGSALDITAAKKVTVTLSGPSSASFTNSGSMVANGAGTAAVNVAVINNGAVSVGAGTLSFLGAVTNNGAIDQTAGLLSIKTTVSGTGSLDVGATGTLSLLLGAGSGQTVDFTAVTGLLDLTKPIDFKGTIDGFGANDQIDLLKTKENSFSFANGVLTVKDGSKTEASLHFSGSYTQSDFSLTSDGHHGVLITFI